MKIIAFTAVIFALIFTFACKSPKGGEGNENSDFFDTIQVMQEIDYLLPSPTEFFSMSRDLGLKYDPKLPNPINSLDNYVQFKNQALNFGIYLADFSYYLVFDKQSEAIKYLYNIQELSKLLNIEEFFSDEFFNRFIANVSNPDSLKGISIEQSAVFFAKMQRIGNDDLALLVTSGALLETIYLAMNSIDENKIDEPTINVVVDIAIIFDTYFSYYNASGNSALNSSLQNLNTDLIEIRNIFTSMAINQTSTSIRKSNVVVLNSNIDHEITDYLLKKLKIEIGQTRSKIVNQQY